MNSRKLKRLWVSSESKAADILIIICDMHLYLFIWYSKKGAYKSVWYSLGMVESKLQRKNTLGE